MWGQWHWGEERKKNDRRTLVPCLAPLSHGHIVHLAQLLRRCSGWGPSTHDAGLMQKPVLATVAIFEKKFIMNFSRMQFISLARVHCATLIRRLHCRPPRRVASRPGAVQRAPFRPFRRQFQRSGAQGSSATEKHKERRGVARHA